MPGNVSPYALLRASMPRQSAVATAYDLYSLAQGASDAPAARETPAGPGAPASRETPAGAGAPAPHETSAASVREAPAARQARVPSGRTHYIADIKSRHQLAAKRASFSPAKR